LISCILRHSALRDPVRAPASVVERRNSSVPAVTGPAPPKKLKKNKKAIWR
jgi:hypothetical protein